MHISLDQAIGRQPRLNRVGQSLLNIGSGASAAYSLRSLTGGEPKAVRIRRDGDNDERDFTTAEIVNEAAAWTNGLQETTLPADVATSAAAYSLRKVKSDYTGHAVRIRRTSDDVEVNVAFDGNDKVSDSSAITVTSGSSTATTLDGFLNETTSIYTSDFSGTDGFSGNQGSIASVDGIGSRDDVLRYTINTSTSSFHMAFKNIGTSSETVRVQGSIYIPSSNSHIDSVAIFIDDGGSATQVGSTIVPTADQWVDFDVTGQVSGAKIHFRAKDGGTFTITDSAGDDVFYLDNVRVDATQSNAAVHTWYDQSGSSKNATQTTAANQPLIAAGGNLLTDGITFDGSSDFLITSSSILSGEDFFVSSVQSLTSTSGVGNDAIWGQYTAGTSGRTLISADLSANDYEFFSQGANGIVLNSSTVSTDKKLLTVSSDGTTANLFRDGALADTDTSVGVSIQDIGFAIGAVSDGTLPYNGSIEEIIIYNSDQSNNRFKIESNINNHYTIYSAAQNGFVNTWYDQSGNGFNAVADADANEPKIVNSGSLLTDGVKFSSGTALKLSGTGLDIFKNTQHAQVFYAIKINDTGTSTTGFFEARNNASQARFLLRNSNATAGRISLGGRRLDSDSFSAFQSDSGHSNEKVVLTGFINYSDTDAFIFKNGTQIGSDTSFLTAGATSDTSSTTITIGRATSSFTAEFDAEELIIFNTDQTANRTAIETNIANAHGITLS